MLCLCAQNQDNAEVDPCKDFAQLIRKKEFEEACIELTDSSTEKFKHYIKLLSSVTTCEDIYHLYYGQIRKIIRSFLRYYNQSIDALIKKADYYTHNVKRDDLIILIDKTMSGHQLKQVEFAESFLPVKTPWEKRVYEEVENMYEDFMNKLLDIKDVVHFKLDRQSRVEEFVKEHFPISLRQTGEIFNTAHLYIAKMLADRIPQIRVSLEQIQQRLRNNLNNMEVERDEVIQKLMHQLYEKNKESMAVVRSAYRNSIAEAEVNRSIECLRTRIEHYQSHSSMGRLQKEVEHWTSKVDDFREIANNLASLRKQQDETIQKQKDTQLLQCQKNPECQKDCASAFPKVYYERMEELNRRIINETRALISFFAIRGSNRILYLDGTGHYYVDEFNHQVYVFELGYQTYHRDCYGEFVPEAPEQLYLYDKYGRYIMKDGEKLYQLASCTSYYRLTDQNYFEKVTPDCGHSASGNKSCRMQIRDPMDVAILPDYDPIDISKTLPAEWARYLWAAFGSILPEALSDVARAQPNNPIHYLAHRILHHKYRRNKSELKKERKDAEEYRANIFKARREKAEAASKQWRSKLVKRRKPEESDDIDAKAYDAAKIAEEMFIVGVNREYGN